MINQIIKFSIKNKLLIGIMTVALIAAGIWSIKKVPFDAVPDITNNQVQVITQAPNLGTEDIEQFVTYPVELSMANLPGVTEIRSISRFGISVVTIVFEDDMGTYLPRQLVSEKLSEVRKEIPAGFGTPEMGPISTGLGEIYQYTLQVDEAHQGSYNLTQLRSIQDWIVKRQLAMIPGVVEVNGFGGNIKEYEVAVDPDKLRAIDVTISEVFRALENNNQNTGGAYIEKDHYANFIRGDGLVRSLDDIEKIVVKNVNGIPITVGDVADVRFGKAVRYGALTMDGKGETVGGMILMLKGANSNDVIQDVRKRVSEIQKTLPEGVKIVPFLDRSKLISKTTSTVTNNLMEGALVVIFILVFLLGNWRGGLIVASTIPLSLLFAFILMNLFGVWANLMSLGAIDFGIIVDGAVIIVEGTVFLLSGRIVREKKMNQLQRDEIAEKASSKMMNSAFFGQLIILIVFIPILALEGVEGKMFQPMALTFMFAMIGAMLLCLTYVPMMSALFLRTGSKKKTWGDKIVLWTEGIYERLLNAFLLAGRWVVLSAVGLLVLATFLFSRMGGEFIPQLDEGDIAFHAILKPGSSLSETVSITTQIENQILSNFPEVEHVISRIGVADVPTDPMPMDVADVIVILKEPEDWQSAETKAELVEKMKSKVSEVAGVNFEFTQPIEMRFNELITGVREDIAIKLFGDDLDILADKVEEIGQIVSSIEGVGDMKVEATSGLPQITAHYNRSKISQYGLQINQLNSVIQYAFAGGKAGVIFEGEARYDLVIRLDSSHRSNIDNLKNLYISTSNGAQIPLKEVADINYQSGPMQISRDNTKRRAYVGINVRNRDVQSLVEEIKEELDARLDLPPGYFLQYGGTFENLERAVSRLKIVVPVALGLIFLFIFFALKSFKQTIMIYMAIPLAAIGGVFFLWIRDMHFSISAGVGFIVLFGVAVLNGLVLISGWNELKEEGISDVKTRITLGAKRRIRPILLTALTDILGFLPMALSTSAGAEVQQPLATVVIGGMISATFLTLFVLPILYLWTEKKSGPKLRNTAALIILLLSISLSPSLLYAQTDSMITSVEQAVKIGLKNNGTTVSARQQIGLKEKEQKGAFNPGKTEVAFQYGQYNSYRNDLAININQKFEFPTVYTAQWNLGEHEIRGSELQLAIHENRLRRDIRQIWYELLFLQEKRRILEYHDSLLQEFVRAATIRYQTEETNLLEKVTAETRKMQSANDLNIIVAEIVMKEKELRKLMNDTLQTTIQPGNFELKQLENIQDTSLLRKNPMLAFTEHQIEVEKSRIRVEKSKLLPNLSVGYFNQSMLDMPLSSGDLATSKDRFQGVNLGLSIPLFFGSYRSQIETAKIKEDIAATNFNYYQNALLREFEIQLETVKVKSENLNYYTSEALPQAELLIENANKSYRSGAIDYMEYFRSLTYGIEIKLDALTAKNDYNQAIINLDYLLGQ